MVRMMWVAGALAGCASSGGPAGDAGGLLRGVTDSEETTKTESTPGSKTSQVDTGMQGVSFMTGGGTIRGKDGRATHGLHLVCELDAGPQNLQVNWQGHRFHLTELDSVACTDDPKIDPESPSADFDTLTATGVGRLDGVDGFSVEVVLTDAGEPGRDDFGHIVIDGGKVLDVAGTLQGGNHQAHGPGDSTDSTDSTDDRTSTDESTSTGT